MAIPKDPERQFILELLMQRLEGLDNNDRYAVWSRAMREFGLGDRRRLLHDLMFVQPILDDEQTGNLLVTMAEAIAETDDWFS